ncbi:hypothetical protein HPB52_020306 [Rhipicephalus sanguineus]|uniref:Uncharacterized protein n=1 Tax=Rhipicephalus sanguineus TaxID=34632 RepID=A0A9D4TBJ3_RHISA|nr:hypothetical protein HPB52_020306 [Rhipicephalus sanguineus]
MQPVQRESKWRREAELSGAVPPPAQPLHSGWTPPPTWAAPSPDSRLLAESAWSAAAVPPDRSYPGYYHEGYSGPISEQSLDLESAREPSKPSSPECLSFVLGIAFAGLLLGIGLLVVHNSLSPYDMTPDAEEDALERRLDVAPNSVGQSLIPRSDVHPDVDERGSRKTTISTRARIQVTGRAANGATARLQPTRAKTSTKTPPVTAAATEARGEDEPQPRRAVTGESCIRHVYTHCVHPRPEFYYSADRRACVAAATDTVHVCNRGSNRFSSMESCLASCVNGRRVSDRCYESTLFFPCARQDLLDVPWYFDGRKCVAWSFPQGSCLSVGRRGVFRSLEECRRRCVLRKESECDETPAAEACSTRQLRYPYFADMQAHGGAHCVNASRRTLQSHRCLIGSNQFASLDACRRACVGG